MKGKKNELFCSIFLQISTDWNYQMVKIIVFNHKIYLASDIKLIEKISDVFFLHVDIWRVKIHSMPIDMWFLNGTHNDASYLLDIGPKVIRFHLQLFVDSFIDSQSPIFNEKLRTKSWKKRNVSKKFYTASNYLP